MRDDSERLRRIGDRLAARRESESAGGLYWPWLQHEDGRLVAPLPVKDANKFVLGCIINQARRADQSWAAAQRIAEESFGDPDELWAVIATFSADQWAEQYARLRPIVGLRARHDRVWRIGSRLAAEYAGDARLLWEGQTPSEVQHRLDDLGFGPKISRMTVGALIDTGHLAGSGDLAPDTHVRRVLGRLVRGETAAVDDAILLGRLVNPPNPWLLDAPLYQLGIEVCRKRPRCEACALRPDCAHVAASAIAAATPGRVQVKRRTKPTARRVLRVR
jgi:endonuclease III